MSRALRQATNEGDTPLSIYIYCECIAISSHCVTNTRSHYVRVYAVRPLRWPTVLRRVFALIHIASIHCARKRWLVLPATMRQPLLRSRLASPAKRIEHLMCCEKMKERETVPDLFEAIRCPTVSMSDLGIGLFNRHHCSFWPLPWTTSSISQAIHIARQKHVRILYTFTLRGQYIIRRCYGVYSLSELACASFHVQHFSGSIPFLAFPVFAIHLATSFVRGDASWCALRRCACASTCG